MQLQLPLEVFKATAHKFMHARQLPQQPAEASDDKQQAFAMDVQAIDFVLSAHSFCLLLSFFGLSLTELTEAELAG